MPKLENDESIESGRKEVLISLPICLMKSFPAAALFLVVLAACTLPAPASSSPTCRCLAFEDCWPRPKAWRRLNESLSGRLIAVRPPASPCHDPTFNAAACEFARGRWTNTFWITDQPGAMVEHGWEMKGDLGCNITGNRSEPCYQGAVPVYAVNVTGSRDVQRAVRFASRHNLRLVVKNTGHDYDGKSTAEGSLSIWTHNLKEQTFHDDFVPENCGLSEGSALTIGAGVQWIEAYNSTFQQQRLIMGGGFPTVGAAGGYTQGGGHGALAPTFGLAADNVLQLEIVTADGKRRIANKCQNTDLFWAVRGGGGGTFGVVISATFRTYPALENLVHFNINVTSEESTTRTLVTRFTELNPSLRDAGWVGFFLITPRTFNASFIRLNSSISDANSTLAQFWTSIADLDIDFVSDISSFPSFFEWFTQVQCGPNCNRDRVGSFTTGTPPSFSSRLIPRDTIASSAAELTETFFQILQIQPLVFGSLLGGGKVSQPQDNAVNPAWRETLWIIKLPGSAPGNATGAALLTEATKLLIDFTPNSGAYLNEADFNEPDWQFSFFGHNYPRLYSIKQEVDPEGLFVCHHCVGSEDWSQDLNCKQPLIAIR